LGKDPRLNAEKQLRKADRIYEMGAFRRAGRTYNDTGEMYLKLHEFEVARDCFYDAAKSFINSENFLLLIQSLRNAGDASLLLNDFSEAHQFFKNVTKYANNIRNINERESLLVIFSALSYLCLFIEGKQDLGLNYMKQIKKEVGSTYFNESPLIRLVKNLTIAIRDKNKTYLDKVEKEFDKYKFREAENLLMKKVLVLAKTHISIITQLSLDKEEYTTKEMINLTLTIDTNPLLEISKYSFYNYNLKELKIKNIGIALSDNLITKNKPNLPIVLKPGKKEQFSFTIRPNFQVDNTFIGPILLTCEIDGIMIFFLKTQTIKPNLISPPPTLEISLKNLRPPLIDKTFPMEIKIENNSEGEALEIMMEIEFPEQLKLMRGTKKKQIYSLKTNESINWEVSLKPTEIGDFEIKMDVKFKDPDQNLIEYTKSFPFSIKL